MAIKTQPTNDPHLIELECELWPIGAHSGQKQPDNFGEIFQAKAELGKYLTEKCWSECHQNISFKYSVDSNLIYKLLLKVLKIQTTIQKWLQH